MGRSQRHMLWEQGETAAGEIHAQGVVAPGIAMQVNPEAVGELQAGPPLYNDGLELKQPREEGGVEVPIGEPGGPLSGSSLTGAIPEELQPGPGPEPGEPPVLSSLEPATGVLNGPNITMHCIGSGFTEQSQIYFANQPEPIVFISEGDITTIITMSLPWGPATVPVFVQNADGQSSGTLSFIFTEGEPAEELGTRTFPIGPINIANIDDHADGIQLTLSAAADVQGGDTVLIEATGNTGINGSYPVLLSDGTVIVVDNPMELLTPIEAKGRLTVTG